LPKAPRRSKYPHTSGYFAREATMSSIGPGRD
jgi:hypothetical protein